MVSFNNIKMICKGFKKVPLKDTKGILTKNNNFKWVKNRKEATETVLLTGTKITKYLSGSKYIEKANDIKVLIRSSLGRGAYSIATAEKTNKKGLYDNVKTIKLYTKEDILKGKTEKAIATLNKKRKAFVENFNKNFERTIIKGDDGTVTKMTHNRKTGKLEHWFRKDGKTGKFSIGDVFYSLGGRDKEVCVETSDKIIYKNLFNFKDLFGEKSVSKVSIPKK